MNLVGEEMWGWLKKDRTDVPLLEDPSFYQKMVEEMEVSLLFIDPEGRIVYANPRAKKFMGKEIIGRKVEEIVRGAEFVDPGDAEKVIESFRRRQKGEEVPPYKIQVIFKGGRRAWVSIEGKARWKGRRFEGTYIVARDVTPLVEQTRESEEKRMLVEAICNCTPDAIMISDKKGIISFFNRGAEEIFGYRAEEVIGTEVSQYFASADQAKEVKRALLDSPEGRIKNMIVKFRHKEGREVLLNLSAALLPSEGEDLKILVIGKDVTDDYRRAEEIRALKEFNEYVFNSLGEGLNVVDKDGIITQANLKMAQLIGLDSPQELIGREWRDLFAPESWKVMEEELRRLKRGERSRYEAFLITRDGEKVPVMVSGTPLMEGKEYRGSIAVFTDIRELKAKEEELEAKVAELEKWYRLTVDRELKMIELKNRIRELEEKLGMREEES